MMLITSELKSIVMTIHDSMGNVKLKKKIRACGGCNATPMVAMNFASPKNRLVVYYSIIEGCDFYATFTVGKHTLFQQSFKIL